MSEFTYSDDLPSGWKNLIDSEPPSDSISAFAFDVAQSIEDLITEKVGQTLEDNKYLSAKILNWYMQTKDEKFAEYFNIQAF